jgi:serpin B
MLSRTNLTCAFALSLAASACSSAPVSSKQPTDPGTPPAGVTLDHSAAPRDPASPPAIQAAVDANNAFAFKLYGQVAGTASGPNVLTSPLSASLALTMTYAGAQGQTATEMAAALELPSPDASIFDAQNSLTQALSGRAAAALASDQRNAGGATPSSSDYDLSIVNSVWGQKTYPWAAPFLDVLAKSYGTGVFLEDFVGSPDAAKDTINSWVSSETADKINDLLPGGSITSETRIVLVNAVHLKLPWAEPFQASNTASGSFTRGDGSTVTASFMHGFTEQYLETPTAQGVSLPLAGNELSVVFLEPKTTLTDLVSSLSSLTPETWAAATKTQSAAVNLALPKFNFTSPTFSLAEALKGLGMKAAFDPQAANFKGLCAAPPDGQNLYIGDVLQKAMMGVSETGVEAAAATAVIGVGTAAPTKTVDLTFDHPFLVAIVDASGAIVFLGQIGDPTAAGSP